MAVSGPGDISSCTQIEEFVLHGFASDCHSYTWLSCIFELGSSVNGNNILSLVIVASLMSHSSVNSHCEGLWLFEKTPLTLSLHQVGNRFLAVSR